ncbi:MAG: treZ [Acidimicrobiales bacterium]|nr:treZ [Acidimicrobiales bacterium]
MTDLQTAAPPGDVLPWELPLGARPTPRGTTVFRAWAPAAEEVAVRIGDQDHEARRGLLGVWEAELPAIHGDDYEFVLDGTAWPDPWSRWQPEGIRGPSRILDPERFDWTSQRPVLDRRDLVVYELHVGTFSAEGTFDGAIAHLAALRDLGVTAVELMPINEFPGRRGWGYDGTHIAAAHSAYGGPEGLQRLVDAAHRQGLGVILDVVYNHVGASGTPNLEAFGPWFTDRYHTFWGMAPNYDDADSGAVREWVLQSAEGWVRDFRIDGLRVDACHAIYDQGARHLLAELSERVRRQWPHTVVIAESGLNDPKVTRPSEVGGWGFDADWSDDFHHALRALLTGDMSGWYADFGSVAQLAKAYHRPYVFDGGWSPYRSRRFGAPAADRRPEQFVVFSQNHDQVGNRALGDRLPSTARPLAALCTLLAPFTPMLFMGEEYGEQAPFQFFTDHIDADIADATREGRRREFARFVEFTGDEVPDPQDPATFERSKLQRRVDPGLQALYRRLLTVRRDLPDVEVDTEVDEDARWLRVERGAYDLVCNFAAYAQPVPCRGHEVVVATHDTTADDIDRVAGTVHLPPLAGVLLR